eukprot:GHRR01025388.1.p1 GENE.GHRR01025388.1~~GHRR01025388.1.p1  ORF type:complete len:106 (-),score=13.04 GHRR01025388.1:415-732(-)
MLNALGDSKNMSFHLICPSAVRLARVVWPLYSTVSTSSPGLSKLSSIKVLMFTKPAGRFGARRGLVAACLRAREGCRTSSTKRTQLHSCESLQDVQDAASWLHGC